MNSFSKFLSLLTKSFIVSWFQSRTEDEQLVSYFIGADYVSLGNPSSSKPVWSEPVETKKAVAIPGWAPPHLDTGTTVFLGVRVIAL